MNLDESIKFHNFLHKWFYSGVKNLNTCVQDFCVMPVVWSVWVHDSIYGF